MLIRCWNSLMLASALPRAMVVVAGRAWHLAVSVERRPCLAPAFAAFSCAVVILSMPALLREVWS